MPKTSKSARIGLSIALLICLIQTGLCVGLQPAPEGDTDLLTLLLACLPVPALAIMMQMTRREPMGWFLTLIYIPAAIYGWWVLLRADDPLLPGLLGFAIFPLNLAAIALTLTYLFMAALRKIVDKWDHLHDFPDRRMK